MQLRTGRLVALAMLLSSVSAMAQITSLTPQDDRAVLGNGGRVTIPVLKNDSSSDGKALYVKRVGKPKNGVAWMAGDPEHESHGQVIVYQAGPSFSGTDSFQYTVTNLSGATATATVRVFGPRYALAGSVGTIITDVDGKTVGYLQLDAKSTGVFSGKIRLGLNDYSLLGSLDRNGHYAGQARGENGKTVPVSLEVTQSGDVTKLSGTVGKDREWAVSQEVGSLTDEDFALIEGRYTVELPATASTTTTNEDGTVEENSNTGDAPQGSGWMVVEINEHGDARLKGRTGDGRSFSVKAQVGAEGGAPVLPFYEAWGASVIGGKLRIGDTIDGDLTWTRGQSDEERYPEGFDLRVAASGARYVEPKKGARALATESSDGGRATITVSGEGLDEFTRELRFSEGDDVTDIEADGDPIDLKVDRESGTFSGKFRDPDDRDVRVKFSGVLMQREGRAVGLFEAKNKTGLIELQVKAEETDNGSDTDPDTDVDTNTDVEPSPDDNGLFFETGF